MSSPRERGGPARLGVLISGSGTNLQAILDGCASGDIPARVALVVSNKADAFGLERARRAGVASRVLSHRDHADRAAFDAAVVAALREAGAEIIVLAGFMRVVTPVLLEAFRDRVLNIHPSLLPAFPGVEAQKQALEHGAKVSGCTVHLVDESLDGGPILLQAAVPVLQDDDVERLRARILEQEHRLLPRAIRLVAEGRVERIAGTRRVRIRED